ncbi:TonB-dependent receptor [Sphingobacterium chuzhouense]|uniref:TonB-dependent receptor n=1 Tax=Sphingobacterium chuzhouense TaxID=1742264 RepID=A0ABR7XUR5_9SPHI|nr:TonB-dependent receptor [Sphingobacterium chuzhouense]MBD1422796.1 TonB-dependent receptor [Sphingobacterium chuzhouense]
MKLTITFMLIATLNAMSTGLAQTVTLRLKNTSLEAAFSSIRQQTGYRFIYPEGALLNTKKVSLDVQNVPLKDVMDKLVENQPLRYQLHDGTIVLKTLPSAIVEKKVIAAVQQVLRGVVKDNVGERLSSVTIRNLTSGGVTSSDQDGNFELQGVNLQDKLLFSLIGHAPHTLVIMNFEPKDIQLSIEDQHIDDVVVVGYGVQKRRNVVGSISQIDGEELQKTAPMNLTNALGGRLPGLSTLQQSGRPGSDNATLRIRGVSTYASGAQAPLIVIDGVERPSFSYLDPSEIESISILKDAVSTAVYGLQATNGIILITTKKGRVDDTRISYEGSFQIGQNTRFPKFLNAIDYMLWYNKGTDMDNDYHLHQNSDPVPYVYGPKLIRSIADGTNTNPLFGQTDWVGELLANNSKSHHHAVSISGGNDKARYFSSLSHLDQGGVIQNTNFKRYNVRTNVSSKLTNLLSGDLNLSYRAEIGKTPGLSPDNTSYLNPFYQAAMMLPNLPKYAENGVYTAHQSSPGWVNPLASVENSGYQHRNNFVFQGDINLKFSVPGVDGLDLQLLTAFDKTSLEAKTWLQPYQLMGRAREQRTGDFVELHTVPGISRTSLTQSHSQNSRITFRPYINYSRTFGLHDITVLGLYEWSKYQSSVLSGGARNFPLDGLHEIDFGSTALEDLVAPGGSSSLTARAGYVARLNYAYDSKYLLEVASRWDASVNFAKHNRWQMFPGFGVGWVISNEGFFKERISFVDFFKLKYSVGKTGNDRVVSAFPYLQTYVLSDDPVYAIGGTPVPSLSTSAPPNLELLWETSTTHNIGFESQWLDNKLGFDIEFFHRFTVDIINPASGIYPPTMGGFFPSSVNDGEMLNRGVDIQFRYNNEVNDFRYSLTGNFNWARNKIIKRQESENLPAWQRTVGRPYGQKLGFVVDGIYQTWEETQDAVSPSGGIVAPGFFKYRDLNNDGRITRADDMTFIGRSNMPEIMYGLNIDLQYKGFDFSTLLQGAALSSVLLSGTYEGSSGTNGIDAYTVMSRAFYQNGNSPYFLVENSWTPENPNAEFPRLTAGKASLGTHNSHSNSGFLRNGTYLRVKSAQLGYTLPSAAVEKMKLNNVRLHFTASNLFTWDHLKYFDPEMPNVNNGFYPQQKLFSFGASITFK